MVILKNADDLQKMKTAGEISAGALKIAKDTLHIGVSTAHIDREIKRYIEERGATPSFLGYRGFPASSCISVNEEVIHGIPSDRKVLDGDIVSIDVGAYYDGFHGDNAATFAIGNVTKEHMKLLDVTKECLFRAIEIANTSTRIGDIGYVVQTHAEQNGFSVVRAFTGHGLGKSLHEDPEVPNFGKKGSKMRLTKGMTIAIEPMINLGCMQVSVLENRWTVVTNDRKYSAHFEMSIAITDDKPIILTDWREVL